MATNTPANQPDTVNNPATAAARPGLMVRCPSCGQPHEYSTDNPYLKRPGFRGGQLV